MSDILRKEKRRKDEKREGEKKENEKGEEGQMRLMAMKTLRGNLLTYIGATGAVGGGTVDAG